MKKIKSPNSMEEAARMLDAEGRKHPPGTVFMFKGLPYVSFERSLRHTNPHLRKLSDRELSKAIEKNVIWREQLADPKISREEKQRIRKKLQVALENLRFTAGMDKMKDAFKEDYKKPSLKLPSGWFPGKV